MALPAPLIRGSPSSGSVSTGYKFPQASNGTSPIPGGLVEATNGILYGTTVVGGTNNLGTVFSLDAGLKPVVTAVPPVATVGTSIGILGSNLTGATSVTFNGTAANFVVVSPTQITTTVPAGATTGKIEVVTPSGPLHSNIAPFRVLPVITGFSPSSGSTGSTVVISGQSFLGTTAVTFWNDVNAAFKIDSQGQISARVPAGAQTGPIQVTTRGGTVASTGAFRVN